MIQFEASAEYTIPPPLLKRLPVYPKWHCKNQLIKKLLDISFSKLTVVWILNEYFICQMIQRRKINKSH